ncbi:MAG: hypothetical protein WAX77_07275 [Methylococcaceae bacterium]
MKKISFALIALFFFGSAQADCLPADISGSWVMYQTNISAQVPHTGRCEIKVADKTSRSFTGDCALSNGAQFPVTGTATILNNCSASLSMNFTGGSFSFDVQLATDKQAFVGQWTNSFGDVGGTNAVKK